MDQAPRVDPDVDLHEPADRRELAAGRWSVLAAISAGGVLGALGRTLLQQAAPTRAGGFPWATFTINVTGCLLIGILMVLVSRRWPDRRLLRPFAGVGVLGGFTTFSAYALEVHEAVAVGAVPVALGYLAGTVFAALLAVTAGTALAERLVPELRR
ncbi:fluoride efflux transporter FluC [Plantactinospora sp. GCM10030261]|uniref:fluoride efflux transporter FluC n=1 Tax=Plantactinospora sp. GCM10030261 TaxID=3273420 RepID=UPI0036080F4F